jgi:hypothetical protein
MSRCPISGKFVARDNPGTPKVTKPDGEEVVFCCPSHKKRYLRENPVKFNRYMQDALLNILANDYAHRFISSNPEYNEMDPYDQRGEIYGAWTLFLRQMSNDPFPSDMQRLDALTKFMAEHFNLRKRDVKTILRRGVRTEGRRQVEEARELAPGKLWYDRDRVKYTILDEDSRAEGMAVARAQRRAAIAEEKEEQRFTQDVLSLVGQADPLDMVPGTEGLYIHSFNTMPQPTTASQFRDFMNIKGEVCFSTLEEDKTLYIPRRQDAFLAVVVKGTPRLHAPGDVWSERDYRGQRYPTRPAEEWHSHDEAFVTPRDSDLRAILVSPNHWHLSRIRKAAQELGIVLIIMRAPPILNLDSMMAEEQEWRESERELWGRIYDDLYGRRGKGYKSIDLNVYGEMDVDREIPVRKRKYKSRPRRRQPKFRKNPGAVDPQGRYIPEKYLAGLPPELRAARIRELGESRDEYGTGDFSELPTDRAARKMGLVKLSAYRVVAQQRGFDISQVSDMKDMATKALRYYGVKPTAAVVNKLAAGLEKVYDKGLAAWKSGGHRPGATGRNWADARVASVLVGGKAAWTADKKQFAMLPPKALRAVIDQLPELYQALAEQGRQRDINYIQKASGMTAHSNPAVGGSQPTLDELVLYIHKVIGVGNDEIDAKVSAAYYRDAHRFVDPIHPSSSSDAEAYLQHLAATTTLTDEDIAAITRDALKWWRESLAYGVQRKRRWLGDVRRWAAEAEHEDRFFRSDMDELFADPKYRQTVGRQLEAARKLGYEALPGWNFGERALWRCVAPENHLCGSAEIDGTLYVKHPDHWADMSAYPTPHPGKEFNRWIYLAKKHKNLAFPTYFLSGRREAVEEWLRNRTPSRKALEGKLKKFVANLPVTHDFRNYPVPEWVLHFGGRHIANDAELQVVGRRNGWCFGSSHYASHLQELIDEDSYLYLIPHPDGLIALKLLREGGRKGLSFPNDLDQTFAFYEAKFPNNEEATPAVKMLWRQWLADQQDTVPARVRGSKSRSTRRDKRKRGKRSKRERYDPTFRKRGGRRNPHEEI